MNWHDQALVDIKADEGLRLEAYQDGGGVWTIGFGHTSGVKIGQTCTRTQADVWLLQDVGTAERDLNVNCPWWLKAPDPVRRGLLNMCFNLGWPRLHGFVKMLSAGSQGLYNKMAEEAEASNWARQVGGRATRISALFRAGAQLELEV